MHIELANYYELPYRQQLAGQAISAGGASYGETFGWMPVIVDSKTHAPVAYITKPPHRKLRKAQQPVKWTDLKSGPSDRPIQVGPE
jgi:hypothetical protein